MKDKQIEIISVIQNFNRFYSGVLEIINSATAFSDYSPTEARILQEIGYSRNCIANELALKLNLDKGYVSRILNKFETRELVYRQKSKGDARSNLLFLTREGQKILHKIEENSGRIIQKIIENLSQKEKENLASAMRYIEKSLLIPGQNINIRPFEKKDIKTIIERHVTLYHEEYKLEGPFRQYIVDTFEEFFKNYDKDRENIWVAEMHTKIIGSIGITSSDDITAQIKWFLIEPEMRGKGLGKKLMKTALSYCKKKNYQKVFLWNMDFLDAARHLLQKYNFHLLDTLEHSIWGRKITEEYWVRELS